MDSKQITQIAIGALKDVKGEKIVILDTHKMSALFNALVICSGNSTRQVLALAKSVSDKFKQHNIEIIGVEGKNSGEWVLVDCGYVVVHIMLPQVRSYYDIESLWHDNR